jgi:capsular polysaccharide biosynthesis protein
MINVIIGFVLGFFVASVGFTGIAASLDKGIETIKTISVKVDNGQ